MFSEKPADTRPQRADAAHHHLDAHSGLRRPVERVDDLLVDKGVGLATDSALGAATCRLDLALDALDDSLADAVRSDSRLRYDIFLE